MFAFVKRKSNFASDKKKESMYDQFNYKRRESDRIKVGKVYLGGPEPVRVQSMANTDTNDTPNSVAQCMRIVDAGGEIVRFTAQGTREAENLNQIHRVLREAGYDVPLVADIHFNANAADVAAQYVEKVRVNPGNFIGVTRASGQDYTDEEYQAEFEKIRERFGKLLDICKDHSTAIRIGVNHGSLSERMMNRWGDTPRGMVESCMEFLNICQEQNFHDVVISMKNSNSVMMVQTVRLLVFEMEKAGYKYPLHLGVTEAGDGEDGRIKSAAGIGGLLNDGIGDTIRVSLSEEPEFEIPVAVKLVKHVNSKMGHPHIQAQEYKDFNRFEFNRRLSSPVSNIGGENVPVVVMTADGGFATVPDYLLKDGKVLDQEGVEHSLFSAEETNALKNDKSALKFLQLTYGDLTSDMIELLRTEFGIVVLLSSYHANPVGEMRAFFHKLLIEDVKVPVILSRSYVLDELEDLQIQTASDLGALLIDGFGDGLLVENLASKIGVEEVNSVAFGLLQATRMRVTKTEFISCPSCGRTMFNLQTVIARVKARTSHLKGLKIGIMGCIVNGPGEMADADYGYVGAGRGKVSLYKKKECIERNIPEEDAVDRLVDLIRSHGDWHD